jgi:arabinofuranosyltransferase
MLAVCLLGAILSAIWCRSMRHEDAFVAFRYARNIAGGNGFVFNPGERLLGTASPLFTLLLAAAYPLFGDGIADLALVISGLGLGAQAFVFYRLLRDAFPRTAVLVALLVLGGLARPNHFFAMETNFALALGLGAVESFRVGRSKLSGCLFGLALLARYDALLFAIPILGLGWSNRRRMLHTAAVAALLVMPWLVFALAYFGSPVPHALGGKFGLTPFAACAKAFFSEALQLPGLEGVPKSLRLPPALLVLGFSSWLLFRRARALFWLGIYGLALLASFAFLGPPKGQTWYVYGGFLSVRVCLVAGASGWIESRAWSRPLRFLPAAALSVLAAYAALLFWQLERFSHELRVEYWLNVRQSRYQAVASYATSHFPGPQTMMATEVASLGYLTDYRMIDPYGLLTEGNGWSRSQSSADYAALLARYRPSLVLFDSPEAAAEIAASAPQLRYRVVKVFDWGKPWSTLAVRQD